MKTVVLLVVGLFAACSRGGDITDLGTLGGGSSRAYGVNAAGAVVGESETRSGAIHAFLWRPGQGPAGNGAGMIDLGTLGGRTSRANDINSSDEVVGESETTSGVRAAFLWTTNGGMRRLDADPATAPSYAYAINTFGMAAGGVDTAEGSRAVVWSNGVVFDLVIEPGKNAVAYDINDSGYTAGQVDDIAPENRISAAFIHRRSEPATSLLPQPAGLSSSAQALNNLHRAAGYFEGTNHQTHAFVFDGVQGLRDIDTMSNAYSSAESINTAGDVVGVFFHGTADDDRAFLYHGGAMRDLNDSIDTNEWLLIEASDINDSGQIVGYGLHGHRERAFVLGLGAGY